MKNKFETYRCKGLVISSVVFFAAMLISICFDAEISGFCLLMFVLCGAGALDCHHNKRNKTDRDLFNDKMDDYTMD